MLSVAPRARAGAFDFADTSWEGTSEFLALAREELGPERVRVAATLDFDSLTPKDGVLLFHPENDLDEESLGAFLASGGRVAVLDDHGTSPSLLDRYRIRRVPAPLRPAQALRDNPNLAFAAPAVQSVAGQEQNRQGEPDEQAFVTRSLLVHEWRKFLFTDPGLPQQLLPSAWPGRTASAYFDEQAARLLPAASRFVDACLTSETAGAT